MRYVGGKYRIAPKIAPIIRVVANGRSTYLEPFLGGGAVFRLVAPHFPRAIGADVVPDLISMWTAARDGWAPPETLTEDEYRELRHAESSALRGFAGFGMSFGGKWFGGYFRPGGQTVDPVAESRRAVLRDSAGMRCAELIVSDYAQHIVTSDYVIYCDPPYVGKTGYDAAGDFDSAMFWRVAEAWARAGAFVLVSENSAPAGWMIAWEGVRRQYLGSNHGKRPASPERLYVWAG